MRTRIAVVVAVVAVVAVPASAQEEQLPRLWTECAAMQLVVGDVSNEARDLALTTTILEAAAAARLRAARLLVDDPTYGLWIGFDFLKVASGRRVTGVAFDLKVRFFQPLWDPVAGAWRAAATWNDSMLGTTGNLGVDARQFVLGALDELLDRFISEYLRANEAACGGPAAP